MSGRRDEKLSLLYRYFKNIVKRAWNKITYTKALENTSGHYETLFFEDSYRVFYLAGLSKHDRNILYLAYSTTVKSLVVLFITCELWHLVSAKSSLDFIDNINVTLRHLIALYRYHNMNKNISLYNRLSSAMEHEYFDVSTNERQELMYSWVRTRIRYLKLLLGLGTCTLAAWYIYPLVDDIEYNLQVAIRLPFEYDNMYYAPTYIIVLIAFHYTSYFVMCNDLILQTYLMHLLCQFDVLSNCFEKILEDCKEDARNANCFQTNEIIMIRLKNLVKQHQFIISNTLELKRVLKLPMLYHFIVSSMLFCFAGFQVAVTTNASLIKFLMTLFYFTYNMMELYVFCRWCEELQIQSLNVGYAIYSLGWEAGFTKHTGVRSTIMIIMMRANQPLILTAGGLYDLTLASYSTVVKTSYSAMTILLKK